MRLFFSLPLPADVRDELRGPLEKARGICGRTLSFGNPAQLHFTLAFLGDQDEPALERAGAAAAAVTGEPFDLHIKGAGAFPSLSRPRVVWLGLQKGGDEMIELARVLREQLARNGVSFDEKPFRPHLTVARLKSRGRLPDEALSILESCEAGARATEFHLVRSKGGRHEALRSFALQGRAM